MSKIAVMTLDPLFTLRIGLRSHINTLTPFTGSWNPTVPTYLEGLVVGRHDLLLRGSGLSRGPSRSIIGPDSGSLGPQGSLPSI